MLISDGNGWNYQDGPGVPEEPSFQCRPVQGQGLPPETERDVYDVIHPQTEGGTSLLKLWAVAQAHYRQPEGAAAWQEIERLIGHDGYQFVAVLTGILWDAVTEEILQKGL